MDADNQLEIGELMPVEQTNDDSGSVVRRATVGGALGVFFSALASSCFILFLCTWVAWGELFFDWLIALAISNISMVAYCYMKRHGGDEAASRSLLIAVGIATVCALVSVLIPYVLNFSDLPSLANLASRKMGSSEGLEALMLRIRFGLYGGGASYAPGILMNTGLFGALSGSAIIAIGAIPVFVANAMEKYRG